MSSSNKYSEYIYLLPEHGGVQLAMARNTFNSLKEVINKYGRSIFIVPPEVPRLEELLGNPPSPSAWKWKTTGAATALIEMATKLSMRIPEGEADRKQLKALFKECMTELESIAPYFREADTDVALADLEHWVKRVEIILPDLESELLKLMSAPPAVNEAAKANEEVHDDGSGSETDEASTPANSGMNTTRSGNTMLIPASMNTGRTD